MSLINHAKNLHSRELNLTNLKTKIINKEILQEKDQILNAIEYDLSEPKCIFVPIRLTSFIIHGKLFVTSIRTDGDNRWIIDTAALFKN